MGRRLRSYLPGAAYHITARLQGREPLFVGRERRIVQMIHDATTRSDLRVVAYVVMPNHLHLVVIQGTQPLADYMQPLLCRIALMLRLTLKREGHIFERRYHESACLDAEYFRNAVTYVHLNPVRACLVSDALEYAWSSHRLYCNAAVQVANPAIQSEAGLRLFALHHDDAREACAAEYVRFVAWRVATDRFREALGVDVPVPPLRPYCDGGDKHWQRAHVTPPAATHFTRPRPGMRSDLRDVALGVLSIQAPEMSLTQLRSGERGLQLVRVRREAIARALLVGHRPSQIARFFAISTSAVSRVHASLRKP